MMVERYPNLTEEVGGLISGSEIFSLLTENLPGGQLPPVLWRWPVILLSRKRRSKREVFPLNDYFDDYTYYGSWCHMIFYVTMVTSRRPLLMNE